MHQDELNVFLKDSKNKVGVDFLEACMEFLDAKVEIKGLENLPENGKCTFVSNHPLGGQDGVALGYILGKHYNGNAVSYTHLSTFSRITTLGLKYKVSPTMSPKPTWPMILNLPCNPSLSLRKTLI